MTHSSPLPGNQRVDGTLGANAPSRSESSSSTPNQGPAFKALLESLEARAKDLRSQAGDVKEPADLAGAVDQAGASLQDALSLSDRLLEAYRAASTRDDSPDARGDAPSRKA